MVRSLAAQTADSKIRVWGPDFPSIAILWFVRHWVLNVTKISILNLPIYYKLKNTSITDQHSVHTANADVYLMCEMPATVNVYTAACSQSDADWHFFQNNTSCSLHNVCIINWKQIATTNRISNSGRNAAYLETDVAYVFWVGLFIIHMFRFFIKAV